MTTKQKHHETRLRLLLLRRESHKGALHRTRSQATRRHILRLLAPILQELKRCGWTETPAPPAPARTRVLLGRRTLTASSTAVA